MHASGVGSRSGKVVCLVSSVSITEQATQTHLEDVGGIGLPEHEPAYDQLGADRL
jgi:hypothetical protein